MGGSAQLLEQLEADGFIEVLPGGAGARPAGEPVAASGTDLGKLKSLATRLLLDQLGPLADELSLRIEATRDLPKFVEAMKRAYTVVRDVKGQAAADRLGAEVEALLPKA
jgi:hypothetical protein